MSFRLSQVREACFWTVGAPFAFKPFAKWPQLAFAPVLPSWQRSLSALLPAALSRRAMPLVPRLRPQVAAAADDRPLLDAAPPTGAAGWRASLVVTPPRFDLLEPHGRPLPP